MCIYIIGNGSIPKISVNTIYWYYWSCWSQIVKIHWLKIFLFWSIVSIINSRFFSSEDHQPNRYFFESIDHRHQSCWCFFTHGAHLWTKPTFICPVCWAGDELSVSVHQGTHLHLFCLLSLWWTVWTLHIRNHIFLCSVCWAGDKLPEE